MRVGTVLYSTPTGNEERIIRMQPSVFRQRGNLVKATYIFNIVVKNSSYFEKTTITRKRRGLVFFSWLVELQSMTCWLTDACYLIFLKKQNEWIFCFCDENFKRSTRNIKRWRRNEFWSFLLRIAVLGTSGANVINFSSSRIFGTFFEINFQNDLLHTLQIIVPHKLSVMF